MAYNKAKVSEDFRKGRTQLDHGYYHEAIDTFTKLIDLTAPYIDHDKDSKVTWDTSLNNRGVAKCKLGYSSGDKKMYESGLEDYRTTVNTFDEQEREPLTAQSNLIYGEKEIKDFETMKGVQFRAWDL
jgi:hypothetical protein